MDTLEILREQVRQHPDDETLALAYRDALTEIADVPPDSAATMVHQFREVLLAPGRLAQATNLMRSDTDSGKYLASLVRRVLRRVLTADALIVLVEENIPPTPRWRDDWLGMIQTRAACCRVGAVWILHQWEERKRELKRRAERDNASTGRS